MPKAEASERLNGIIYRIKRLEDILEEDNQPAWIVTELLELRKELRQVQEVEYGS